MSPKQLRMRQGLMALYVQVPEEIAKDITNVVMDAVDESDKDINRLAKEASDSKHEVHACHKCWDNFRDDVCVVIPEMQNAPLFSQAERIVGIITSQRQAMSQMAEALKDLLAHKSKDGMQGDHVCWIGETTLILAEKALENYEQNTKQTH